MTKREQRISRLKSIPKDYTFTEAKALLTSLGFVQKDKGKTSGSRVRFYRERDKSIIDLHRPHPGNVMKPYLVKLLYRKLLEGGDIIE